MYKDAITEELVLEALKRIPYPGMSRDIVSFGMIKKIAIEGRDLHVELSITTGKEEVKPKLERQILAELRQIDGVGECSVTVLLQAPSEPKEKPPRYFRDIERVIAVASGKGGVGKSTVATNLAVTYAAQGLRTGLLDADIYGPSLQMMMGITDRPLVRDGKMVPSLAHEVHVISLGLLVDTDQAMIWRGPMVMQAFEQLIRDTDWPELDVMIIDLPPGTGDVQLSLSQQVHVTGAVVVTTPQKVALIDARKAVNMFQKVEVPILGFVENMSYYVCPHCGEKDYIFAQEGGKATAAGSGHLLLGEIPLNQEIRQGGDEGHPGVLADESQREIYYTIFDKIESRITSLQPE